MSLEIGKLFSNFGGNFIHKFSWLSWGKSSEQQTVKYNKKELTR